MGRLTRRAEADGVKAVWYGKRDVFLEGEVGYTEADKLAHYEDMEEQGRLIEQKHGTWLEADDGDGVVCSVCRTDFCTLIFETDSFIYCPHCGAKLKELEGNHIVDANKKVEGVKACQTE